MSAPLSHLHDILVNKFFHAVFRSCCEDQASGIWQFLLEHGFQCKSYSLSSMQAISSGESYYTRTCWDTFLSGIINYFLRVMVWVCNIGRVRFANAKATLYTQYLPGMHRHSLVLFVYGAWKQWLKFELGEMPGLLWEWRSFGTLQIRCSFCQN